MQNENVKFKIPEILKSLSYGRKEKITEIYKEIYSSGESSDSSRSFQFEKTRRINQRALSKTEIPKEAKVKKKTSSSSPIPKQYANSRNLQSSNK